MIGLRTPLVAVTLAIALLVPAAAIAAKPPAKKKPDAAAPAAAKPPIVTPASAPVDQGPAPATAAPTVEPEFPAEPSATPFGGDAPEAGFDDKETEEEAPRSLFEGLLLNFNLGFATAGGKDGPDIPALSAGGNDPPAGTPSLAQQAKNFPDSYKRAITTNKGGGLAIAIQIGYNIKGYVSLWADISGHGSFGSSLDTAGLGTGAVMLGFHPLRFAKKGQLPIDLKLYGGYGFFEILGYSEAEFQPDHSAKGKAWLGTSIPFGLSTEYKFNKKGPFAMGFDLRFVSASYTKWVYNNDRDIASKLTTPETTFRVEPRLMFGWHF